MKKLVTASFHQLVFVMAIASTGKQLTTATEEAHVIETVTVTVETEQAPLHCCDQMVLLSALIQPMRSLSRCRRQYGAPT
jgi:hypothetical protein